MSGEFFNNYWPAFGALFFSVLLIANKCIEWREHKQQQSWLGSEGEIARVFKHPKLIAYYVSFTHNEMRCYFEERRLYTDHRYSIGETVSILYDPQAEFLKDVPPEDQTLFASKLGIGLQQAAKITDNSNSSWMMDLFTLLLIATCIGVQWKILQ